MTITKIQKSGGPPAPNIHLGAACPELVSTCLTAPDKSGTLAEQTRQILENAPCLKDFVDDESRGHFEGLCELLEQLGIAY